MDRKQLIKELQLKFETKARYLGVPSFAYEIVIRGITYTIDREGRIMTESGEKLQPEELLNKANKTDSEEAETTAKEVLATEGMNYELKFPMEGHSAKTLRNLINMVYAKQPLIKKALGVTSEILLEKFVQDINQVPMETVEEIQDALEQTENYSEQRIQFDFKEKTLTFKLELEPTKVDAAISLLVLVNKNASAQHYASFKVKPTTNEKYTFRTWLLRLGMIGDEYKNVRRELLRDLSGNGSYKEPSKVGEHDEA